MENFKRSLSIMLITAMVATSLPFSVFAEENVKQNEVQETVGNISVESNDAGAEDITEKISDFMQVYIKDQTAQIEEVSFDGGDGTESNPYLISTKEQLNKVRDNLSAYYKLIVDIVFTEEDFANGGDFYNDGKGWEPIGVDNDTSFSGTFDGNGKTIIGLHINTDLQYVGLFGCSKGTITNLGMVDSIIINNSSSEAWVGGIAGRNYKTIDNSYNTGSVRGESSFGEVLIGGIAGDNGGTISNSYNTGYVIGSDTTVCVGGITGRNFETIANSYNTGIVSAENGNITTVGGIVGENYFGAISNSYNTGSVSVNGDEYSSYTYAGGIAGENQCGTIGNNYNIGSVSVKGCMYAYIGGITGCNDKTLCKCYNTGNVIVDGCSTVNVGGIAGFNKSYGTSIDCYYLDICSIGIGSGSDTTTKCTAEQMQSQETFVGFDFTSIWTMEGNKEYPYPELKVLSTINESMAYIVRQGENQYYASLSDAIAAVEDGETIEITEDFTTTERLVIDTAKAFIIDFNGYICTMSETTNSSGDFSGFENVGMEILPGQTITFTNGTLNADPANTEGYQDRGNISIMIFDYGNLTLNDMIIDGTNLYGPSGEDTAIVELNGDLNIIGTTTIIDTEYGRALEVAGDSDNYKDGAHVVINTTGSIGKIIASAIGTGTMTRKSGISIQAGNIESISVDDNIDISISGGLFNKRFDEAYCATGYYQIKNSDEKYTVAIKEYVVSLQSRIEGTDSGVANVTGGGLDITYIEGTTISAPAVTGYTFLGWYKNYSATQNGDLVSTDSTYLYKPTDNVMLTAVYKIKTNATYSLRVNASRFTVSGVNAVQNSDFKGVFDAAEKVTVKFADNNSDFLYWVNDSDKVVSDKSEYTFTIGANTSIHAVYSDKEVGNQALVVFVSEYNQIMQAQTYTADDRVIYPIAPAKLGCTFENWILDSGIIATEQAIKSKIAKENIIKVYPKYTSNGGTYSVTVKYEGITKDNSVISDNPVGKACQLTAEETVGDKFFQYWKNGNGTVISYNRVHSVYAVKNLTVTAVYGDESITPQAAISIDDITVQMLNGKYELTFMESYSLIPGMSLVGTGFVVTIDGKQATRERLIIGGSNVVDFRSSLTDAEGTYVMNAVIGKSTTVVYARAFVQYLDGQGEVQTVYSEIVGKSYDDLK